MAKQVINVGTTAGDGRGDPLRDAMIKINANFTELYDGIVVQTIVGENGTTLVDISTNSVNANALTGTVPAGVATWDNLGGKPTSVAASGILDLYNIAQTDAQIASEIDDLKVELGSGGAGAIDASVLTGSLPAIDGSALTGITAGTASSLDGDMTGSVFADDSTLLVDGVNGIIPGSVINGSISVPSITGVGGGSTNYLDLYADYVGQVSKDGQKRIFATDTVNDVFEIGTTAPYSEYQPTLKVYGNAQFGSITLTGGSALTGDITGSVYADDSTLLVDGVNGTLNSSALTKPIALADDEKITFGDGDDLEIHHTGGVNYIAGAGGTILTGNWLYLRKPGSAENYLICKADGAVEVYYDNVKKLETTTDGISVTGKITGLTDPTAAQDAATKAYVDANIGGGGAETDPIVGAVNGIVKADGAGNISAAVAGTDYSTFDGAFSSLSGTPTTLSGYGITDALTAGGALTGSGLEPTSVGTGDGNDLTLTGGDATELNSTGGDANITGGSGALASGNVNIGATQTTLVTIGSGSNNVDFPSGTAVDFTGVTITGTSFLTTVAFADLTSTPTTLGGYGITDAANTSTETTFTKDVHFDRGVEEKFQTLTGQSGVVIHNWNDGHVFYHTTPAGDITANFTNVNLTAEYATNVTIIINQGATPYEVTAVQIAGVAQTINWQGGSAPTGTANGIDSFSFTILNDGGSYVVLGQMVDFT